MSPDILIVDTGAGTGNGISAAIQYSNLVIAVTEPTPLGLHDLESILKVSRGMGYETWIVINRSGIGPDEDHLRLAREYGVEKVYRIPYSRRVAVAYAHGRPIVVEDPADEASKALHELAEDIASRIAEVISA
jgi:MinD superfamily P-loop ATPase